jgi:hypothetical protein
MECLGLKPRLRPTASSYGFISFYSCGNVRISYPYYLKLDVEWALYSKVRVVYDYLVS